MTREEAIDVLKHNYPSACFTDLCEAVEIAIQALSAQPVDKDIYVLNKDTISRQAAIDEASKDGAYGYISVEELKQLPSA